MNTIQKLTFKLIDAHFQNEEKKVEGAMHEINLFYLQTPISQNLPPWSLDRDLREPMSILVEI